ncbi:MAG: hypothetical protein ACLFVC_00350 [Opitutales bacterium]
MKHTKQQALIAWIIWFAMLQSAFIYHFFLGDGFPSGENAPEPMAAAVWALAFAPLVLATAVRWLVIPKLRQPPQILVAMIIGLALSEASVFVELFLMADYPQNQIAVLLVAVVCLIQFAPTYATPGYRQGANDPSAG